MTRYISRIDAMIEAMSCSALERGEVHITVPKEVFVALCKEVERAHDKSYAYTEIKMLRDVLNVVIRPINKFDQKKD